MLVHLREVDESHLDFLLVGGLVDVDGLVEAANVADAAPARGELHQAVTVGSEVFNPNEPNIKKNISDMT